MKANKRKEKDVMKLLTSNYEIEIKEDNMSEFTVILEGPNDSPYEGVSYLLIASNHQTFLFVSERWWPQLIQILCMSEDDLLSLNKWLDHDLLEIVLIWAFYVLLYVHLLKHWNLVNFYRWKHWVYIHNFYLGQMEATSNATRELPIQVTIHRVFEQNLPPQHRWSVSAKLGDSDCFCSSGSVCLDVINQTWSPMYELINVFDVFLPQLLLYPNPTDPLNGDAANVMMSDKDKYDETVSLRNVHD